MTNEKQFLLAIPGAINQDSETVSDGEVVDIIETMVQSRLKELDNNER